MSEHMCVSCGTFINSSGCPHCLERVLNTPTGIDSDIFNKHTNPEYVSDAKPITRKQIEEAVGKFFKTEVNSFLQVSEKNFTDFLAKELGL